MTLDGLCAVKQAQFGRIGQGVVLIAFPCLFAPAFLNATQPELTNYIPLIRHPAYDLGLLLLALGILAPVVRLFLNLPGRRPATPLTLAMSVAGFIYILALISFGAAAALLARQSELEFSRELLFWGGGHVLQFVYTAVLLTNWWIMKWYRHDSR